MNNHNKPTLICFPYAGGGAQAFGPLLPFLEETLAVKEVQLPGRGVRFHEPLLDDISSIAEDVWKQVEGCLQPPYYLFGHSMGSLLAYITVHRIRRLGLPAPMHIFLSGRQAPSVPLPIEEQETYRLPRAEFKAKLQDYGGMHREILQNDEIFSFFEPIIRADFKALQAWEYQSQPLLEVPATILRGEADRITELDMQAWQLEFAKPIQMQTFLGGHFFLFEQAEKIAAIIQTSLRSVSLSTLPGGVR